MKSIAFSWDDNKNNANKKKHRVSFDEAQKEEKEYFGGAR